MKLAIKDYYDSNGDKKMLFNRDRIDAAWAFVANSKMLVNFVPWVVQTLAEIAATKGPEIFMPGADSGQQESALDILRNDAMNRDWAYVVPSQQDADTIIIGCAGIPHAYAQTLYDELTGKALQHPANIRISPVKYGVQLNPNGGTTGVQPIDELLKPKM